MSAANLLAIHTITTKPWSTEQCIENYAAAGVGGITFWRYNFEGRDPAVEGRTGTPTGANMSTMNRNSTSG